MKNVLLNYIDSLFKDDMTEVEHENLLFTRSQVERLNDELCQKLIEDEFPYLIEKTPLHDKVEKSITDRLNKTRPDDREVSYLDYCSVLGQLEGIIHNMARERIVLGFTHDDLESFMQMKVYQVLRRGQYDFKRSAPKFFQFVFRNLINDINKCKNSAIKDCDLDALSDCYDLNNCKGQDFLEDRKD